MTSIPKNLHRIVSLSAGNLVKKSAEKRSFIVNEVPHEVSIETDEKVISAILDNLLTNIISNSAYGCIRVKACEYDDIICVSIKDNGSLLNHDFIDNMDEIHLLAKSLNGNLSIRSLENKFTAILLSFPNFPKRAA